MDQQPKKLKKRIRPSRADLAAAQQKEAARRNQRKNIMDAAARLFCEKGFANTTMDQIAARVRLTKPSLYSRIRGESKFKGKFHREVKGKRRLDEGGDVTKFKGDCENFLALLENVEGNQKVEVKREIMLTCLDEAVKRCKNAIFEVERDTSGRGKHRLRFVADRYADVAFQELGMRLLLSVGTQWLSPEQRETLADVNDRFKSLLADSMPIGAAAPQRLSEMFVSVVQGLALSQNSTETKKQMVSIFLDVMIAGLYGARSVD
jgi:AcrR family transcriptional regulator